jgi:hypothetical protein
MIHWVVGVGSGTSHAGGRGRGVADKTPVPAAHWSAEDLIALSQIIGGSFIAYAMQTERSSIALRVWCLPQQFQYLGAAECALARARLQIGRAVVARLVHSQLPSTRQLKPDQSTPAFLGDGLRERDAFGGQFFDGRIDVVAHEIKLVRSRRSARGVHSDLGRRQLEDQPPPARVDVRVRQDICKEGTVGLWITAVNNYVPTVDHKIYRTLPCDSCRASNRNTATTPPDRRPASAVENRRD